MVGLNRYSQVTSAALVTVRSSGSWVGVLLLVFLFRVAGPVTWGDARTALVYVIGVLFFNDTATPEIYTEPA